MKKFQFTFTLPDSALHVVRFVESLTTGEFGTVPFSGSSLSVTPKDGHTLVTFVGQMSDSLYQKFDVFLNGSTSAVEKYAKVNKLSLNDCNLTFFAVGPDNDESSR